MSFKWTPEEDEILKVEWDAGTIAADISAKLTDRSINSVINRAKTLGLPKRGQGRRTRNIRLWTKDENETLLALFAERVSLSEIARTLNRTVTSVDWRLMVLGAKRMSEGKVRAEPKVTITKRPCLRCGHSFASEGAHNRICGRCKSGSIWRSGGDYEARI